MDRVPVAKLAGVSHRYGAVTALEAVDVVLPAGCMVGLIGPDGVGKSSLLALVSGARQIQAGKVEVLGGDIGDRRFRASVQPRIAYMPQGLGRNLYPTLSVFENVDFFGRLFGQGKREREQRIAELLASTGLSPFRDRPAAKLSGGMKQKLGLCCALIHDPDLLILDEPTTGVDPLSRRQFWELIDSIRARRPGMSVLVATAYMEEAERFDWLVAMDGGKVIGTGTPAELRAQTGQTTLDGAFIRLLPEERRQAHHELVIPPRVGDGGTYAIEADGLSQRFGDFTAVDHVSFKIERGEIFGFLGSNGCGKTTTMKMLTGLLPPTEGVAKLFGKAVDAGDVAKAKTAYVNARTFYEKIESDVEGFVMPGFKVGDNKGNLDYLIDMRASNLDEKVGWSGFHAVERDLWKTGTIGDGTKKYAADLQTNVGKLVDVVKTLTFKPEDLGVDVTPRLKTVKVSEPAKRGAGVKVADVAALVDKLKNEAKVI